MRPGNGKWALRFRHRFCSVELGGLVGGSVGLGGLVGGSVEFGGLVGGSVGLGGLVGGSGQCRFAHKPA